MMNLHEILQFASKRVCLSQELLLVHHVYLITYGSIVTKSITLFKYMCYVIIIKRKPYLSIYDLLAPIY